jgi:hypothetical protein
MYCCRRQGHVSLAHWSFLVRMQSRRGAVAGLGRTWNQHQGQVRVMSAMRLEPRRSSSLWRARGLIERGEGIFAGRPGLRRVVEAEHAGRLRRGAEKAESRCVYFANSGRGTRDAHDCHPEAGMYAGVQRVVVVVVQGVGRGTIVPCGYGPFTFRDRTPQPHRLLDSQRSSIVAIIWGFEVPTYRRAGANVIHE